MLLAGTAAVAANIGILNKADSSTIGDLTATDELLPTAGADADIPTTVTIESVPSTTPTTPTTLADTPDTTAAQQYDIAGTGTVWVMTTTSGVALDHVVAETGWTPTLTQADLRSLRVEFVNGDRTVVFTASIGDDGRVIVDVTEPTTIVAATPAAPTATPSAAPATGDRYEDDEYEDDDRYEDDEYEDHDDDHEDDEHEYEGADDDD